MRISQLENASHIDSPGVSRLHLVKYNSQFPFHKQSTVDIQNILQFSKKYFKRADGMIYKPSKQM